MAALDFPTSPTVNQTYTANGKTWRWDGTTWLITSSTSVAIPPGMVQIEQVVCTGSQSTITFSNIPQNYADLRIVFRGRDTGSVTNTNMQIKFNSDATAGNYASIVYLAGSGTTAISGTAGADTKGNLVLASVGVSGNANAVMMGEVLIAAYAGAFYKMVSGHASSFYGAGPTTVVNWYSGVWKSTAAITNIVLSASSTAFVDGTVATLYGIGGEGAQVVMPTGDPTICCGRLTLESGVPISTSDQTAKMTVYWTPYKGNRVSIYDGASSWLTLSSAEISVALGTLTSGKNYDVFAYNNAGTLALELGAAWTNDTTRSTALVMQDGVYVKSGATTRRYLGTFRTTATTTTEDSGGGTTTQVGGKRFLWNYYNRVNRDAKVIDTTDSWAYNTGTWRQANGAAGNKVEVVVGVAEESISATVVSHGSVYSCIAQAAKTGVGADSTSAPSGVTGNAYNPSTTQIQFETVGLYRGVLSAGYHYLAWLEKGPNSGSFYGDDGGNGTQSGMTATIQG